MSECKLIQVLISVVIKTNTLFSCQVTTWREGKEKKKKDDISFKYGAADVGATTEAPASALTNQTVCDENQSTQHIQTGGGGEKRQWFGDRDRYTLHPPP